ncbi:MAG: site-specific DNA-methyltransferase [Candidatus Hatepunaea meridiana]|nr:site-specific DNA-methyltransferase [Candidatus Hatepunaea meridiana]
MADSYLYFGDNLDVLRQHIADESIDLIYLDPPFNSDKDYVALSGKRRSADILPTLQLLAGEDARATKGRVFKDIWRWDDEVNNNFQRIIECNNNRLSQTLTAFSQLIGKNGLLAYIVMLAPRLVELHRVLKPTGSIYLHCDQHASAYIRLLMDAIFGSENFLNCIVWCYGLGGSSPRYWPRKHDDILWYSKEPNKHNFEAVQIPATSQRMKGQMKKAPDFWNIPTINNMAKERTGFPTQKPEALLERIIESSSRKGDIVLDPFCGSGTTLCVAHRLGRKWVGIDNAPKAVELVEERLGILFGCEAVYKLKLTFSN